MAQDDLAALSTCFGGGGAFGFGFNMGVADGLRDVGVQVANFPMLGTSAGSMTAAALATGLSFDDAAAIWATRVPSLRRLTPRRFGWRPAELMEPLFGSTPPPVDNVTGVAVALRTMRRHTFDSRTYRLVDITAASSAVAPLARPHQIEGHSYIDGGFRSMASADLAAPAAQLLLITPFAHPSQGAAGRLGQWQAAREIQTWISRSSGSVLHIRPTQAIAKLSSSRPRDVGDIRVGQRVYPVARDLGREVGERLSDPRSSEAANVIPTDSGG